jgi:probable F420-dependent oxidoreductase
MRFSLAEAMCDVSHYAPLARAAEEAGFHAMTLPDSVAYPEVSDSKYPYTPDGDRGFLEDKPFLDPFCLASALGAVTTRLRFHTFVVKLPIRHPVLVAKQVASVAALTQNRFAFGVGLSPWAEDYRLTGVPWEGRGRRMDEMLAVLRGLLRGGYFGFEGDCFRFERVKLCPVPARPVPLLVGGHSEAALERAARLADGWMHGGSDTAELTRLVARVLELRRQHGRDGDPFEIHVLSKDAYSRDGLRRLEAMGVTDAIVGFRNAYERDEMPLEKKIAAVRRLGEKVVGAVG